MSSPPEETQTLAMRGRRDRAVVEEEDLAAASEMVLCIGNTLLDYRKFSNRPTIASVAFHISSRRRKVLLMAESEISGKQILQDSLRVYSMGFICLVPYRVGSGRDKLDPVHYLGRVNGFSWPK